MLAVADAIDEQVDPLVPADSSFAHTVAFIRALATVASDDREAAQAVVRAHALDSLDGRIGHAESDAIILLAELARREGDVERARELLKTAVIPRGQASTLAAARLAAMLDVRDEMERDFRQNFWDAAWIFDRPKRALASELARRGWMPASRAGSARAELDSAVTSLPP